MAEQSNLAWTTLVVGLGQTGLSVVRHLAQRGEKIAVVDSRAQPPGSEVLQAEYPTVPHHFGAFEQAVDWFAHAKTLVVSPGITVATPEIKAAQARGAEIIGDIELFVREAQAPIIAITGSNGKSSVTTLVDLMAKACGWQSYAGGNLGFAALEMLEKPIPDVYVMELSSFQLETTYSLNAQSAVVLNVSEDHMDRYDSYADYAAAKEKIYARCACAIFNRDDPLVVDMLETTPPARSISFGLDQPDAHQYGLREKDGKAWLARGQEYLLPLDRLRLPGEHNAANVLAALALGEAAGMSMPHMLEAAQSFSGLPHRTQWVRERRGVNWYDDSKGTNVGATVAALRGMPRKTVLIAGGQGKGADFSPLNPAVQAKARAVVLMGEDADKIQAALQGEVPIRRVTSMDEAVSVAAALAQQGDNVLLSPACASFDMFRNYNHRGEVFTETVLRLPA